MKNLQIIKENHRQEIEGLGDWFKSQPNKEQYAKIYAVQMTALNDYYFVIENNKEIENLNINDYTKKVWSK